MRARLKGINIVKRKLASGKIATYFYHRATGQRLPGLPGSPEFLSAYAAIEEDIRQRDAGTLGGLIRDFQKTSRWRKLAASTQSEYRRVLAFWEDEYGSCPFAALEEKDFRRDVLRWHDEFSEAKPREADNRVVILARLLSWAAKDGPLSANVLTGVERAYQGDRSDVIWLPEHVEAFNAVASPEMRLALALALHTGQRQGDLLRLTWASYDGAKISLRQNKAKRGDREGRLIEVPCTLALKATLDRLERCSPLILTTKTGKPFKKRYFSDQWQETCRRAGLENLHFHDIRGTTVTMLFRANCNLGEIVAITGHSLRRAQDILDRYLARTSDLATSAIAKFENVYESDFAKRAAKQEVGNDAK
jgi:integrase